MKYKLRNGRIVEDGEYVQVKLTPRIINYLKSINALEECDDTPTFNSIFDLFNMIK